ncbi:ABC1 kinase family protein [Allorhizocola rhizosphaerae]|uniref:ABC1 kinase family protein n=1 Tax=Allorhizocola rhizosphaerae TaxID=1872709 RepID=UPI000E3E1FF3|nr:AarF/UbiB family protein [Allorhizocola rhizosphaerae]
MTRGRLITVTRVFTSLLADEAGHTASALGGRAAGAGAAARRAEAARMALERLGPFWVKVGQIMSTRSDFVPLHMRKEFEKLHDEVGVAPFSIFEPQLEAELGQGWRRMFREVHTAEPLGSASLAQVYRVVLANGQHGVLKLQRPDIREMVLADMRLFRRGARVVRRCAPRFNAVIDIEAMLNVVFEAMEAELDFTVEAANMEQGRRLAERFESISVPQVYLATPKVLVQSQAPGCSIRDVGKGGLPDDQRLAIGRDLLRFMYHGYYLERMFHADPHPGNIFVQKGEQATLIDWGLVGRVDRPTSRDALRILMHVAGNDGSGAARAWLELGRATPWADIAGFCGDIAALVPKLTDASLDQLNFGVTLTSVMKCSARRGIKTSPMISLLARSFSTLEGSIRCIAPELTVTEVLREDICDIMCHLVGETISHTKAASDVLEAIAIAHSAPEQLRSIVRDVANRDLSIQISRAPPSVPGAMAPVLPLAAGLGLVALILHHRRKMQGNR